MIMIVAIVYNSLAPIFFLYTYFIIKFVYVMAPSMVTEAAFCDILSMICCIDFKCGSINWAFSL